jgi:hypothetical protein
MNSRLCIGLILIGIDPLSATGALFQALQFDFGTPLQVSNAFRPTCHIFCANGVAAEAHRLARSRSVKLHGQGTRSRPVPSSAGLFSAV